MPKVNIYMETDNGSKKSLYRGYGAVVEFVRRDGGDTDGVGHVPW